MLAMINKVHVDVCTYIDYIKHRGTFNNLNDFNEYLKETIIGQVPRFWFQGVEFLAEEELNLGTNISIVYSAPVDVPVGDISTLTDILNEVFMSTSMRHITGEDNISIHYNVFLK